MKLVQPSSAWVVVASVTALAGCAGRPQELPGSAATTPGCSRAAALRGGDRCRDRRARVHQRKANHVQDRDADRILILEPANDEDTGVFVGQDGVSILLKSPAGKNSFTPNTDTIGIFQMNFHGGNSWDFSVNPATVVAHGLLQIVGPRWFW